MKTIKNRRAEHDYFIIQTLEAGIALKGTEIKSIRAGKVNFKDSYAKIEDGECWLHNLHISPWEKAAYFNHEAERKRKLLLHKHEIRRLKTKVEEQGMTLIPLELFINDEGLCKITLALAKGKKAYDKREVMRKKDLERDQEG
ncbi:MAG: SsrA-binding protein SmpB [Candidatus Cloacimonadota bacterium]|jgi:SsrA-binding protein|uniref:SsrA-binding protein n=1 Tax=Cloacimonas acidaminovorans (strain Evry) TaxID=459349 RepID=B0VJF2_CLOAI|nr:SsrA-binding protein SmpB [Candidatus Cloacimonas acidaminovorans]MBP8705651.1 SsrA-binding protein SmpB [Candidatus Cloacimonas sp.]MDI9571600.1 SsrA-binding protein SmpB [Candidatus Cloacimonadota bacterium]MDD3606899.1 SsrA-binding protein SmpB [Candidatus Cloacimonas acidaminovorans]MDD5408068.1 SsrA-binding protein SmpB [Candidatus Cloacimonas acidaminovorans]MDY0218028.1 SsrA-binding protein SmpB [Candidatus Cloacimonas acidaminovorans]